MLTMKIVLMIAIIAAVIGYFVLDMLANILREKGIVKKVHNLYGKSMEVPDKVGIILSVLFVIVAMVMDVVGDSSSQFVYDFAVMEKMGLLIAFLILSIGGSYLEYKGVEKKNLFIFEGIIVLLSSLLLPREFLEFGGLLPAFVGYILVVAVWLIGINLFNIYDEFDEASTWHMALIAIGVLIIGFMGAVAQRIGFYAIVIALLLLGYVFYNWFIKIVCFGRSNIKAFAFLVFWLLIRSFSEFAWTLILILPMFVLIDNVYRAYGRYVYKDKDCSVVKKVFEGKYDLRYLLLEIGKIGMTGVILGGLSLYTEKPWLIIVISLIITVSFMVKLVGNYEEKSFKELNKELIDSVKDGFSQAGKGIENIKNKKDDEDK